MKHPSLGRHGRRFLLCGGAASAALMSAGAVHSQSLGNDACGPLVEGVAICEPRDYPDGIHYGGEYPGDITVRLEDGTVVETDQGRPAVHVVTQGGAISIEGAGATLTTHNASGVAAYVEGAGDVRVKVGDVTAISDNTGTTLRGVDTWTDHGDTVIDVGHVRTSGDYATGISAGSVSGAIKIQAKSVETDGYMADGIFARSGGSIAINAGQIQTAGDESRGIVVDGGVGMISIKADSVVTAGFASDGVVATGGGLMVIDVKEIRGDGDYIWGVNAFNGVIDPSGQIISDYTGVSVGKIDLKGAHNIGVNLGSWAKAEAVIDDLTINGDFGIGAMVTGIEGARLMVGSARFTGENTGGLGAESDRDAYVSVGSLVSENGFGVLAYGKYGTAYVDAGSIDVGGHEAIGISAGSLEGGALVRARDVTTRGWKSVGIAATAFRGSVQVYAGGVTTFGDESSGILAAGKDVVVSVSGPVETSGLLSDGVRAVSTLGDAVVVASAGVTTRGDASHALRAVGRYGVTDIGAHDDVTTFGAASHGVFGGGESGDVRIAANRIVTSGEGSHGVNARTYYAELYQGMPETPSETLLNGDIDIRVVDVAVTGAGSIGISARGRGDANLLVGDVSSRHHLAIESDMIGDIALDLRGAARSELGSAVLLKGGNVDARISAGARIQGAVDGLLLTAGSRCVLPNPDDGKSPNPCPNPGDDEGYHNDPEKLQPILRDGEAAVNNAGVIVGGTGHAIRLTHGRLALTNTGRILGSLSLAGEDDRFDNAGLFEMSKDSDFGDGVDLLRNTGIVALAEGKVANILALRNLERFENAGLVDLRNGAIGDQLTISGDFAGQEGSTVALDIDLAKGVADRLVIGGAATGKTGLIFKGDYSVATLGGLDGLVVVETGAGSDADAFSLAPGAGDLGFVGHSLSYDAANRRYALHSAASAAAYRQVGLLQALDGVWTASSDLVGSQNVRSRDAAFDGSPQGGFWFAAQAGESNRDWDAAMVGGGDVDLGYSQDHQGAQFGYERVVSENVRAGVTAGYGQSSLDFSGSSDSFDVSSYNLGAYAGIVRGAVFANVLLKYDQHSAELTSTALTRKVDLDGSTWGLDVEGGYRLGKPTLFFEPLVALRWTTSKSDDLISGAQSLLFKDAEDLSGRLGFRLGGARALAGGDQLSFYGGATVVHSFGDDYHLTLASGNRQSVEAERVETWGQGVVGLSYRSERGLETFAEGQGDVGSGYDAMSARIGMRIRF